MLCLQFCFSQYFLFYQCFMILNTSAPFFCPGAKRNRSPIWFSGICCWINFINKVIQVNLTLICQSKSCLLKQRRFCPQFIHSILCYSSVIWYKWTWAGVVLANMAEPSMTLGFSELCVNLSLSSKGRLDVIWFITTSALTCQHHVACLWWCWDASCSSGYCTYFCSE